MYIIVDEYSSPQKPYYLVRLGNNNYEISADKTKALKIDKMIKAKNILNSLPKILKKYVWNIAIVTENLDEPYKLLDDSEIEIIDNDSIEYDYDNILNTTKSTISQLSKALYEQSVLKKSYQQECERLNRMLSLIEKELCDIDHYIEFNSFSASKGYKISALQKKKLEQRREIKNSIFIYHHFLSTLDEEKIEHAINSINGLDGQKYSPRTNIYDQLKNI